MKHKRYTLNEILNFHGVDKFGKHFKVTKFITDNKNRSRFYIEFDNGYGRWYCKPHIIQNMSGLKKNIVSNKMPDEFIGSTYNIKNERVTILGVHKRRYSYRLSFMIVRWDDGTEGIHRLVDIMNGRIRKKTNTELDRNLQPRIIYTGQTDSFGIYCKIPDEIGDTYKTSEKAVYDHRNMMRRCYSKNTKTSGNISYLNNDIYVCKEWHNIYNFVKWHELNYKPGYELDKDLINPFAHKYSPETCIYIPKILNKSLAVRATNNEYPNGIYKCNLPGRSPYPSGIEINGRFVSAGYFTNILESFIYRKILREYYIGTLAYKLFGCSKLGIDRRILYYCMNYQVFDIRPNVENLIKNDYVINYLKDKTKLTSDDYFILKEKFIKMNSKYFDIKFKVISKCIDDELN